MKKCYSNILVIGLVLSVSALWAKENPTEETAITSNSIKMESQEERNIMHFYGEVEVTSAQFHATCDALEVYADKGSKDPF